MRFLTIAFITLLPFLLMLGLLRGWSAENAPGKINAYEKVFGCWEGSERSCDLDPFNEERRSRELPEIDGGGIL